MHAQAKSKLISEYVERNFRNRDRVVTYTEQRCRVVTYTEQRCRVVTYTEQR